MITLLSKKTYTKENLRFLGNQIYNPLPICRFVGDCSDCPNKLACDDIFRLYEYIDRLNLLNCENFDKSSQIND